MSILGKVLEILFMKLPALTNGIILDRYKRFFADIELEDGTLVTAHCPNTGSMRGCWEPGARVQISHSDNPRRKLAWTLERVDMGQGWLGVNTHRTNPVVVEGILHGRIQGLSGYKTLQTEVTCDHEGERSRLDIFLSEGPGADAYVEVKNVTLLDGNAVSFPDAVTSRGLKHLKTLHWLLKQGYRAVMLFAVNRPGGDHFEPADETDPAYGQALREVAAAGVELIAVRIKHTRDGMEIGEEIPIRL